MFDCWVSAANPDWRTSLIPAAASDQVSRRPKRGASTCVTRQPGGGPGADAAAARHELPDRLAQVAGRQRLLVALVRGALDERLAQEARHLVARDRAGGLEGRGPEDGEVEEALVARVAPERVLRRRGGRDQAREGAHDPGVGAVGRRRRGGRHGAGLSRGYCLETPGGDAARSG